MIKNTLFKHFILFFIAMGLSGCVHHRPAFYSAQVLMKDDKPCFSVENNSETRAVFPKVAVIEIYSNTSNDIGPVWYRSFPPDQSSVWLSPDECITYGEGTEAAPPLHQGFHYAVSINAFINDNNRKYRAYFCLSETPEGKTEIHHVKWNDAVKGYDWSVCEKNG